MEGEVRPGGGAGPLAADACQRAAGSETELLPGK